MSKFIIIGLLAVIAVLLVGTVASSSKQSWTVSVIDDSTPGEVTLRVRLNDGATSAAAGAQPDGGAVALSSGGGAPPPGASVTTRGGPTGLVSSASTQATSEDGCSFLLSSGTHSGTWRECMSGYTPYGFANYYTFTLAHESDVDFRASSASEILLQVREGEDQRDARRGTWASSGDWDEMTTNARLRDRLPAGTYTLSVASEEYDEVRGIPSKNYRLTSSMAVVPTPTIPPTPTVAIYPCDADELRYTQDYPQSTVTTPLPAPPSVTWTRYDARPPNALYPVWHRLYATAFHPASLETESRQYNFYWAAWQRPVWERHEVDITRQAPPERGSSWGGYRIREVCETPRQAEARIVRVLKENVTNDLQSHRASFDNARPLSSIRWSHTCDVEHQDPSYPQEGRVFEIECDVTGVASFQYQTIDRGSVPSKDYLDRILSDTHLGVQYSADAPAHLRHRVGWIHRDALKIRYNGEVLDPWVYVGSDCGSNGGSTYRLLDGSTASCIETHVSPVVGKVVRLAPTVPPTPTPVPGDPTPVATPAPQPRVCTIQATIVGWDWVDRAIVLECT